MDLKSIGSRIRTLRLGSGLSMKALSQQIREKTNVSISSGQISDWENGYKNPSAPGLIALSVYFQVSTDWILKGNDSSDEQMELSLEFTKLQELDQLFIKRYLQLALLQKNVSVPTFIPPAQIQYSPKTGSPQKASAVSEISPGYRAANGRIIPVLKPEAASSHTDWLASIDGYIHLSKSAPGCFAVAVTVDKTDCPEEGAGDTCHAVIVPQNSYEPDDQVVLQATTGELAIERYESRKDSLVLGKVVSSTAAPSE